MHLEQYDRIRARIAAEGLTPEIETRVAIFVCASKAVNLPFLALAGAGMPTLWPGAAAGAGANAAGLVWQHLNTQLFRESEALTLLCRVTRWSSDPVVYAGSAPLVAPLYAECAFVGFTTRPRAGQTLGADALALGHALLATVRLTPILPAEEAQNPFAVALSRIEQENGRLLQTQIRLLKDGYPSVPPSEHEAIIAATVALVERAFDKFLDSLAR